MTHDLKGRPYLTAEEASAGVKVDCDRYFTCMSKRRLLTIQDDPERGLWVPCRQGQHFLDGQLSDDGSFYVGVYKSA